MTMNLIDTPSPATVRPAEDARPRRGTSSPLLGVLPFIGVILFVIDAGRVLFFDHGGDWRHTLFQSAVVYMIGWAGIGAGISHIMFGRHTAKSIGWEQSPFEYEVGLVGLATGVAALMSTGQPVAFALAVILISGIFRVGCGLGHIREMIRNHNFAVNNTRILFIDFVVPAFLLWAYFAWA
jgi:uncharacterized protein DUF6790